MDRKPRNIYRSFFFIGGAVVTTAIAAVAAISSGRELPGAGYAFISICCTVIFVRLVRTGEY